jgi:hypothetical protein
MSDKTLQIPPGYALVPTGNNNAAPGMDRVVKALQTKSGGSRTSKKRGNRKQPSQNTIVYNGPVSVPNSDNNVAVIEVLLHVAATGTITSGILSASITTDPSSATDWASFAASFNEYRTLAMELDVVPVKPFTASTSANQSDVPFFSAVSHETGFSPTNVASLTGLESCKIHHPGSKMSREWKMAGPDEAQFIATASPVSWGAIAFFADQATTGATVQMLKTWLVQFRGHS